MREYDDGGERAQLLATARVAASAAQAMGRLSLVDAVPYLNLLTGNPLLPAEVQHRAKATALSLAKADFALDALLMVIDMMESELQGPGRFP